MIKIVAVLCSLAAPTECHDAVVPAFDVSMTGCMAGVPQLAEWVAREHPFERLASWRCFIGVKREAL